MASTAIHYLSENQYTTKFYYDQNGNLEYLCEAPADTASSSPHWRIQKFIYGADGNVTDKQWAEGTTKFDKVCDDREDYDYS